MLTHRTYTMMHDQQVADLAQRDEWINKGRALGLTDEQMIYHETCVNRLAGMSLESNRDLWRAGWAALLRSILAGNPLIPAEPVTWMHGIWVEMTGIDPFNAPDWWQPSEEFIRRYHTLLMTVQERWVEITARTVEA